MRGNAQCVFFGVTVALASCAAARSAAARTWSASWRRSSARRAMTSGGNPTGLSGSSEIGIRDTPSACFIITASGSMPVTLHARNTAPSRVRNTLAGSAPGSGGGTGAGNGPGGDIAAGFAFAVTAAFGSASQARRTGSSFEANCGNRFSAARIVRTASAVLPLGFPGSGI